LEHLHGIGDLKMFMNGKMAPKVITTTYVWTTTKFVYKCGFKSYEKSGTHICQEVFIYNTVFLDPNHLIALISFALFILFLGFSSIGQMFNLWPPPNKTSPFHWTLDLKPLFQMPLSFLFIDDCKIFLIIMIT
jgi:hypothetical protein